MRSADEEIFVSLVVIKRPTKEGQQAMDPANWTQTILDSLAADGGEHRVYSLATMDRGASQPPTSRVPKVGLQKEARVHRSVGVVPWLQLLLFCLGTLCFVSAGLLTYFMYR